MYQIGDKLKCISFYNIGITVGKIYQIDSLDNDRSIITFKDDDLDTRSIEVKTANKWFEKITKLSSTLNNDEKTLKNPKAVHYNLWLDTDSIDIIKAKLTEVEYIGALKYNILKYQLRLGKKDCIESDMEKIEDYKRELNSILESKKC